MWGGSITDWLWFREMWAGVLAGRDHPASQAVIITPTSLQSPVSNHQQTELSLNLYNPPVKSTGKYYKLTISDVDYHHQRSATQRIPQSYQLLIQNPLLCGQVSLDNKSSDIWKIFFPLGSLLKYFLISKYCAREMIFNQSKLCVFCKSEEAEFKESWTRNGDHYCTLFFRPLRFLRTRHYPKYFPTKTIRQNCPNFNFQ